MNCFRSCCFFLILFFFCSIGHVHGQSNAPKHEMRGVWVATVANIDWPSQPGLSVKQQKREATEIIMHCKQLGLNAIFLQVRPASDVLYSSVLEPWSKVLTGQAGKKPRYDPLEYWVKQAHRQGIELHAWINPYRASMNLTDDLPQEHPYHTTPEMFVEYGNKLYYNPGHPKANIHINRVVKELLLNYDIDGLHMDDYFYPYPIQGQQFPDSTCYQRYGKGAFDQINDWRRANVNNTIRSIHATIESTKPWVQFGISPFGVWRNRSDDPRGSDTKAGTSNYDGLYADVLTWMENKWVDYIAPQIYWGTSHPLANYNVLASWWNNNHYDVPVYIGHGIYKIGSDKPDWQDQRQLPKQMEVVRNASNLSGSIFFSYKHLKRNLLGLQDSLMTNFYKSKSVVPSGASGEAKAVNGEVTKLKANKRRIKWKYVGDNKGEPLKYLIYKYHPKDAFQPDNPDFIYDVSYKSKYKLPKRQSKSTEEFLIRVTVLNAYNEEGTICAPVLLRY